MTTQEEYMSLALDLAREAAAAGEVPVGCVIVKDGVVVGAGRNRREEKHSALSHAEVEAIAKANQALGSWRALPHVRRGHPQRPDLPGVVRRPGQRLRRLRRGGEPLHGGLPPPAGPGRGDPGGCVPGGTDGLFPGPPGRRGRSLTAPGSFPTLALCVMDETLGGVQ